MRVDPSTMADLTRKEGVWYILPFSMTSLNCLVVTLWDRLSIIFGLDRHTSAAFSTATSQCFSSTRSLHAHAEAM